MTVAVTTSAGGSACGNDDGDGLLFGGGDGDGVGGSSDSGSGGNGGGRGDVKTDGESDDGDGARKLVFVLWALLAGSLGF